MPKKKFFNKISEDVMLFLLGILMIILVKLGSKTWDYQVLKTLLIMFAFLYIFGHLKAFIEKSISLEGDIFEKKAKTYLLITYWTSRIFLILVLFY